MKHDVEISVIVPVYNVQKYVRQCVDSILSQDFGDFEVILVDDCSTDGSLTLCEELYGTHPKVQILRLGKNMGPGAARNIGISTARGKYITFVDDDDVLLPNALSLMYAVTTQTGAEIVAGNTHYRSMEEGGSVIREGVRLQLIKPGDLTFCREKVHVFPPLGERAQVILQIYRTLSISSYPWGKLYLRKFLIQHQIRFPDQSIWPEDMLFMLPTLMKAEPYVVMTEPFYVYRVHREATSRKEMSANYMKTLVADGVLGLRYLDRYENDAFFQDVPRLLDALKEAFLLRIMVEKTRYVFESRGFLDEALDIAIQQQLQKYFGQDAAFVKLYYCMANKYFAKYVEMQEENRKLKELIKNMDNYKNGGG